MHTKKLASLCLFLVSCTFSFAQSQGSAHEYPITKRGRPIYAAVVGEIGIPILDFRNYAKVQGGVGFEAGLGFLDNKRSLSAGGTFFGTFTGAKKDTYRGAEIKTSTALMMIGPMLRWAPVVPWRVVPFISAAGGLGVSSTSTTSEIVDKATFIEQFFGMQESDIVDTTSEKESGGVSAGYSLAAGILIKPAFVLKFSYFGINNVKHVDKDDVTVENGEIIYHTNVIPVQMFNISIGVSNWAHRQ